MSYSVYSNKKEAQQTLDYELFDKIKNIEKDVKNLIEKISSARQVESELYKNNINFKNEVIKKFDESPLVLSEELLNNVSEKLLTYIKIVYNI